MTRLEELEARVAKLEEQAKLFEEHRQSWIDLNIKLKKMQDEQAKGHR